MVGAGPAGVSAALAAAEAGVEVLLVDNGRSIGGQYHRQLPVELAARRPERIQHDWKRFASQRDRIAAHPRITYLPETSVWAIEGRRLWAQRGPADASGRQPFSIDATAVVLATGAYDRVLPFPGWDLPGVYTAGAAQALAKGHRVAVGRRVVVAGTGPFLLPVAESLIGVGARVVSLLEANLLSTVRRGWASDPLVAAGKLREVAGYGALLARHRVPLRHGWTVIAAHGTARVEAVTVARLDVNWKVVSGSEREVEVDAVCVGFGFTANLELAVAAHCKLTTGPDGGPAVAVDGDQQTSTPGIFAAGELTGIGGADLSAAEGELAGLAAAHHTQQPTTQQPTTQQPTTQQHHPATTHQHHPTAEGADVTAGQAGPARAQPARLVGRGWRFARALGRAYPVRDGWMGWSDAGTVVCRCEEVLRGELDDAAAARGLADGRALKLSSRAGLGMCQGRVCSRNVAALVARPGEVPNPSMKRPIAVPVRLRDLAAAETGSEPETPETPETPEMREMRETREMREMRETREMPKTPETRGIPTSPETMEEQ
ncbi:FAD/NAD(P)-binding oxidoreductase [Kribbella solani]